MAHVQCNWESPTLKNWGKTNLRVQLSKIEERQIWESNSQKLRKDKSVSPTLKNWGKTNLWVPTLKNWGKTNLRVQLSIIEERRICESNSQKLRKDKSESPNLKNWGKTNLWVQLSKIEERQICIFYHFFVQRRGCMAWVSWPCLVTKRPAKSSSKCWKTCTRAPWRRPNSTGRRRRGRRRPWKRDSPKLGRKRDSRGACQCKVSCLSLYCLAQGTFKLFFFWTLLIFLRKLYLKNFNIKNKDNKISQVRGNSLFLEFKLYAINSFHGAIF